MSLPQGFTQVCIVSRDKFWSYLSLLDILRLSTVSRGASGALLPAETMNRLLLSQEKKILGPVKINFPIDLSLGMFRIVMQRLYSVVEAVISIDDRNGKICLDIGGIHPSHKTGDSVSGDQTTDADEAEDEDKTQIFRNLEKCSFDEYDDFNPRHPMPKDRAHRRGDSYFNSDIEMVVGEIGVMDLSSNAAAARAALLEDFPPEPPVKKQSARDRILAKTKNHIPGRPSKPSIAGALKEEEDEDNDDN